jgi:hypothetical protein
MAFRRQLAFVGVHAKPGGNARQKAEMFYAGFVGLR